MVRAFQTTGDLCEADLFVFEWVKRFIVSMGYPPTVRELAKAFGFSSIKLAHDVLIKLETYGFLDVDRKITRGIRIHNLPSPDEYGVARLKLWLCESASLLRLHCPDALGVQVHLKKISILTS